MATQPQPDPLIRPPLQRRSQESLERVLQAGADLLREVGYEGFTLQEVSSRSGVSVGSIYARAASKEALILAIYDRETARMREENRRIELASRREDLHGRALVEALVHELAAGVLGNADTLRVFMHRAVVDQNFWERGSKGLRGLSATFEGALGAHRDDIRHPGSRSGDRHGLPPRLRHAGAPHLPRPGLRVRPPRLGRRARERARARGGRLPDRARAGLTAQLATGTGRRRSASSISASWLRMCLGVSSPMTFCSSGVWS